jgi:hypothetical protein
VDEVYSAAMSTSTQRMQVLRKRRRAGVILLVIEAEELSLIRALIEAGLLNKDMADDHDHVQRAAQRLIEIISRGDQL